ncbi:putative immunity protein [Streptomyces gobiensis]|uniref:putative immunity protein n=1 Tax=Streptomyces gobiensis TaxID=2875706 RepID=UPI001E3A226E|nr:hypothetical protein [Streptomyces gobiensis]UGY90288.1 hypothetical protein test1122_00115 [Streptomyces gobiensis]
MGTLLVTGDEIGRVVVTATRHVRTGRDRHDPDHPCEKPLVGLGDTNRAFVTAIVFGSGSSRTRHDVRVDTVTISEEDRRFLGLWAADCVERVLPLFEAKAPWDTRPREAVEGIRGFVREGKRTGRLRSVAWAAHAAAGEVGDRAAAAAARAACYAAATPYIHPLATPHQSKHALGPAVYQARARELAAGDDARAGDEEIRWAVEHAWPAVRGLVRRMPPRGPGRSRLDALYYQLDAALRR